MTHPTSAEVEPPDVLVVDGANVVGSRPDGWWRDRAGAAARLHAQLRDTPTLAERVVLVLEGEARGGVPEGRIGGLEVVHAAGEGDDRIVEEIERVSLGERAAVVTADRALASRVAQLGAQLLRPGWLLRQLS